ncbi:hypothetical protein DPEC_G00003010 [Dallia pectoralis]|uniref:Uncharacterized protein n=1 Tax=Dallia pectoralis TaxID=75939 RepID=A0ACC2HJY9_DALPE|nr:hypothetical protein DPEC_G00003010 [Dallia pectoralis]
MFHGRIPALTKLSVWYLRPRFRFPVVSHYIWPVPRSKRRFPRVSQYSRFPSLSFQRWSHSPVLRLPSPPECLSEGLLKPQPPEGFEEESQWPDLVAWSNVPAKIPAAPALILLREQSFCHCH